MLLKKHWNSIYIYSNTEFVDSTHHLDYDLVCPREVVDMAITSFLWRPRVDLKYYRLLCSYLVIETLCEYVFHCGLHKLQSEIEVAGLVPSSLWPPSRNEAISTVRAFPLPPASAKCLECRLSVVLFFFFLHLLNNGRVFNGRRITIATKYRHIGCHTDIVT